MVPWSTMVVDSDSWSAASVAFEMSSAVMPRAPAIEILNGGVKGAYFFPAAGLAGRLVVGPSDDETSRLPLPLPGSRG
jgi:hypothetical protein